MISAYLRVSGRGQIEGDGFSRQEEAISRWAVSAGVEVDQIFREEGISGTTDAEDRPAFQSMIAAISDSGGGIVVVESLDRLARQYDIQQQLATYIAAKGWKLISSNTGEDIAAALLGDPMRRAMVQMQGVFAELEKNMIVSKLKKARERKKESFGRCEGNRPYGETAVHKKISEEILSSEREMVGFIMERKEAGSPSHEIAEKMNEKGWKTRSGTSWKGANIRKICRGILSRNPNFTTLREI